MESQLKISFFLYKAKKAKTGQTPIYLRIRYDYELVTISTGYSVISTTWDKIHKRVRGNSVEVNSINAGLKALEIKIRSIVNRMILSGNPIHVRNIKDVLSETPQNKYTLTNAFEIYLSMINVLIGKDYSPLTLVKYKQTFNRVIEFSNHKYKCSTVFLNKLDDLFMSDFEMYLKTNVQNGQTTIYKHWQRLARVIRYAIKQKMLDVFPFISYSLRLPKKKVEYLTQGEVDRIMNKDFGVDRLNKVRDFFVFSIYSGLAYTELFNLLKENLVIGIDDKIWIDMDRQKTKNNYTVPLLPQALNIIKKYERDPYCIKTGKVFPLPTNQKMNAYLKEIQDICRIKTKLTCHLARKTFSCTIMLLNGVSILVLSKCLGHASIRTTIDFYSSVLPEMVVNEFEILRKKLSK